MKYFKVIYTNGNYSYCMTDCLETVCRIYSDFPVSKIEEVK